MYADIFIVELYRWLNLYQMWMLYGHIIIHGTPYHSNVIVCIQNVVLKLASYKQEDL